MQSRSSRRGLSTARAALQVEWLLAARPQGVRADEVARALGKSVSTAYNLLASLCDEGVAVHHAGGVYSLSPAFREMVGTGAAAPPPEWHDLAALVRALLARTHKRSYVGIVRGGELRVGYERGLQGMPKLPGLAPVIRDNAHALALGKVALALARHDVVERYLEGGLRRFTVHTITEPDELRAELDAIRADGIAVDREEFDDDFCCIAAPVRDPAGRSRAVLGISMTRRAFDDEREALAATVAEVARIAAPSGEFQRSAETRGVLDPREPAGLASANASTVP
jgi:DNA-binding IclR family transcriptional regulator